MAAESELDVTVKGIDQLSPELSAIESRLIRFVGAVSSAIAAIKIGSFPISAAAQFQTQLQNVQKTTNFTATQIQQLSDNLLELSLRTSVSATDLGKIAAAAGQQGLGTAGVKGVTEFTDSVSRMADVLDVSAEDAATSIGQILNVFKLPVSEIEKAVSTFNQVSNNSVASGEKLLDVVKRIGDAGGSLNLNQAVGLAATGIGLGQSPEVVGSAFSNIFSKLKSNADKVLPLVRNEFIHSTTDWVAFLQKDGVAGLKLYLDALRKLTGDSQQNAITKITGGGRQGVLTTKLVQDSSNSLLDKDQAQALDGFSKGTSALREQQTVLQGFQKQVDILYNSLFKLGAQAALNPLIGPDGKEELTTLQLLTTYAAQFGATLQQPGAQQAVHAILGGFNDLVTSVVGVIKWVASLNVNWENFLKVGEAFVALKFGQVINTLIGNLTGLNSITKSITGEQASFAESLKAAWSNTSAQSGLTALISKYKAYQTELRNTEALELEVAAARQKADAAANAEAGTASAARSGLAGTQNAAAAVATQRAAVDAAIQQGNAASQAAQASYQASAAAAQERYLQNQLQIEQTFQTERQAIRDTGTRVGLTALNREYAAQTDANQAQYERSIAGVQSYWATRIEFVQQAANQEVAVQLAALQAEQAQLEGALAQQESLNAAHAAASGGANAANAELNSAVAAQTAAATQTASIFQRMRSIGTSAFQGLVVGVNLLRTALSTLAAVATKAFLWVTIIYSIADALGIVDKLTGSFQSFTDMLGLTSAAQRQQAVDAQAATDKLTAQKKALDDLTKSYKENLDAQTQTVTPDTANAAARRTSEGDQAARSKGLSQFTDLLRGAQAQASSVGGGGDQLLQSQLSAATKQLTDAQAKLQQAKQDLINGSDDQIQGALAAAGAPTANIDSLTKALQAAQSQADAAQKQVTNLENGLAATPAVADKATQSLDNLNAATATLFTSQSADAFQNLIAPLGVAIDNAEDLKAKLTTANQSLKTFTPDDTSDKANDARAQVEAYQAQLEAANKVVDDAKIALGKFISQQQAVPGLDPKVLQSFLDLLGYINSTPEAIAAMSKSIAGVKANPALSFTGANVGSNTVKPTTGTGTFTAHPKSQDSIAKAQFELEKAQLQATFNLQKENDTQLEAQATDFYNRGLEGLQAYYDQRQQIQLAENANEITMLQKQLGALAKERATADSPAAKTRVDANVAQVQGQIAVLQAQRKGIEDQTTRDLRSAQEEFNDMIATQTQTLISDLVSPADISQVFANAFTVGMDSARKTINELRSNGQNALADQIVVGIQFKALNSVQDVVSKQSTLAYDAITNLQAKLTVAQTQGALTSSEAEFELNNAIAARIPLLQQQIALMEQSASSAGVDKNSLAYQQLTQNIDNARVKLLQLQAQQDATAKAINSSITDSLGTALENLQPTFASLKQTALQFLLDIGNAIKKTFAQDIAQTIMKWADGGNSAGGIGGFISSIIGAKNSDALGANAGADGSVGFGAMGTALNPLYVNVVNSGIGALPGTTTTGANSFGFGAPGQTATGGNLFTMPDGTAGASQNDLNQISQGLFSTQNTSQFFSGLSSTLGTSVGAVTSALQGNFSGLMSLLGTLFTSLITTLAAGDSSQAISGALQAGASAAAFAHTGGVIGSTPLRRKSMSPAVFRNAIRYHTGGVAGLAPDEVPTILRKGEEVLTANDPRHRANGGASGGTDSTGGGSGVNIRNVLVSDPNFVPDSMNSAQGERVIMTFLSKNKMTIKQMLG